jgi:hypothetical protein
MDSQVQGHERARRIREVNESRRASVQRNQSKRARLLGMPFDVATRLLQKQIIVAWARRLGLASCFRCGGLVTVETLSFDHKASWMRSPDPLGFYFDIENIALSHLRCNASAAYSAKGAQTHCKRGHPFDEKNTYIRKKCGTNRKKYRLCRTCNRHTQSRYRDSLKGVVQKS